jgi:hypothetical protein
MIGVREGSRKVKLSGSFVTVSWRKVASPANRDLQRPGCKRTLCSLKETTLKVDSVRVA